MRVFSFTAPVLAVSVALVACKGADPQPAQQRPDVLHHIADAPPWAVAYGSEFWRTSPPPATTTVPSHDVRTSDELDLSETMERVGRAFDADLKSTSSTFTATLDGEAVRFQPARSVGEATIALRSIARGDNEIWNAGEGGDAFALGNTAQRQLRAGVVEHLESRNAGVELTWVLATQPEGEGDLHIALDVDGMAALGRTKTGFHFADLLGTSRMRVSDAVIKDSAGAEWHVALTDNAAGDLAIDVPADVLRSAKYPLAIDPVVSAEFGMDTPQPGEIISGYYTRLSCNVGTCLAVWVDTRGPSAVLGTRFDASTGTVLDPSGLQLATDSSGAFVDVAFTGTDFLIVYVSNTGPIKGRRVTTAGATPDPAFVIATNATMPSMAANGSQVVVAYTRYNCCSGTGMDVFAARLDGTTLLVADVPISAATGFEQYPRVAFDGTAFVVTWNRDVSNSDIYAARTTDGGLTFAAPVLVAGGNDIQNFANVCSNGAGSLITWYDNTIFTPQAQRFDATFAPVGGPIALSSLSGDVSCAYNGSNYLVLSSTRRNRLDASTGALLDGANGIVNPGTWQQSDIEVVGTQYVVAYSAYRQDHTMPYVARIAADNTLSDTNGIALTSAAGGQLAPAIASDGTTFFVVWAEAVLGGSNARGVILDANGTAVDPAGLTLGTVNGNDALSAAYGAGHYLATWVDGNFQPRARRVLATSTLEDASSTLLAPFAYGTDVGFDGTRFVATFASGTGTEANTISATTGTAGTRFTVSASAYVNGYLPRIACIATGRCLITWTVQGSTYDVFMARTNNGALLDTTPLPVANSTAEYESNHHVATDGTAFLVMYSGGSSGARARRVAADGSFLDASPIAPGNHALAVNFDGTNYVFVTTTFVASVWSLVLGQVTPAGNALNPSAITLASSSNQMMLPALAHGPGTRRSLVVYSTYDPTSGIQNRRIKGRFVSFTSAPVASDQPVTTNEDTAKAITLSATDTDGDLQTYSIVTPPSHGTLTGSGANRTYTPTQDYFGSDSFTFKTNDGNQDSNTATVSITVSSVNDAPVASDSSVSTSEDTAVATPLVATDVESNSLTYTIVTGPAHGSLSGTAPNLSYTPAGNYNGPDSFTWRASDTTASNTATVSLTISPANDAPTANAQSKTTNEDTAVSITLTGTDPDGDSLTYTVVTGPSHGSLSGTAPNLTYTPAGNYNGGDSFTFKVNDTTVDSSAASVSITVSSVNDAPVASDGSGSTSEETPVGVALAATDIDGDALTYAIVSGPAHGTLGGIAPNLTYTPAANYTGPDSFTWKANDTALDSNTATFSVSISAVNDPPVANGQSLTTDEDTAVAVTLSGSDVDGDSLTYSVVSGPSHGSLSGTLPNLTYTPATDYNGSDSFTFKASDGTLASSVATISIGVAAVNDAPVASDSSKTTTEDNAVAVTLSASDVDGDSLTYAVVSGPAHGTLSGTAPNLTYTPVANYNGSDTFTWKANDTALDSNTAMVSITVSAANDAPVANAQSVTTDEDEAVAITLAGSDGDGDAVTFVVVTPPAHGSLSGTAPNLTYTPAANYNGSDSFTFKGNDGTVDSAAASVGITINPINDAPVASDASKTTAEDTAVAVTLSASDVDGDTLTYSVVGAPAHGTLSGTAPNLTYTPAANYTGSDSFTFKANDTTADSNTATVSISITAVNDVPSATAQSITTAEDTAVAITLSGSDLDGDSLTYSVAGAPAHGALSGTAPNLTYTPVANYNGGDSFTFKASDGTASSSAATISITVNAVNDAPVASNASPTTAEDTPVSVTLSASDVDGDSLTYSIVGAPAHGTLSGTAPNLTYTPAANYNGSDSFTWKANDTTVDSNTATVSITINAANDAPTANAQSLTTPEDTALPITLTGSDIEGDTLTYSIVTPPTLGTLSGTPPNVTFTPAPNDNGNVTFTFKASDGSASSAPATVTINVTAVNDAPVASNGSRTTAEDTAVSVALSASDVDGNPLTYAIVSAPAHGTLSGTAPNLTYTPAANYNGSDSFTWKANDSALDSNTATMSITITATNDAPTATAQSVTTNEDVPATITLAGTDLDGDSLTYTVVTVPAHGALSGTAPNLTYTPVANYNGADSFTFKVNDGTVSSSAAAVSITIAAVNDAPVAGAQTVTTAEDTPVAVTLTATDVEGGSLSYSVVGAPAHGTLSGTAPALTYTPQANYHGADSFTFKANDGTADSIVATVSLTITSVNDAPVAAAQSVSTNEDTQMSVTLGASDVDGDALTFAIATPPAHGTLTGSAPNLTYAPAANYNGTDTFTFKASDGTLSSSVATVTVTIAAVNDAPIAATQTLTVDQGEQLTITLTASDVDGDSLTFAIGTSPDEGVLTGTPPNLTYTAPSAFRGQTTFTFTANDGTLGSAPATITILVNNGAPVVTATADLLNPIEGQNVTFTTTAADPGGDALTFAWDFGDGATSTDQNPVHAYVDDGAYTASVGVSDGIVTTTATVDITVQNGSPIIVPSTEAVTGDEATELMFSADVSDPGSADTLTVTWTWGDGTADSTGMTATHTFADNGTYTVSVTVTDNGGATVVGTRDVTIANVPPVPEAVDPLATDPDVEVTATLHASDRAGAVDPLTWTLVDGPGEVSADGTYRWTPTGADAGGHVVTARVTDDDGGTADLVFEVEVSPPDGGGCCSSSRGGATSSTLLALAVLGLLQRSRRRRPSQR